MSLAISKIVREHIAKVIFLVVGSMSHGCAHQTPVTKISDNTFGFDEPTVFLTIEQNEEERLLTDFREELISMTDSGLTKLRQADEYNSWARKLFWAGLLGGIVSGISDGRGYVQGRTLGNAMWGVGWISWLGFSGLAHAEWDDARLEYNERWHADRDRSATDNKVFQFRVVLGDF